MKINTKTKMKVKIIMNVMMKNKMKIKSDNGDHHDDAADIGQRWELLVMAVMTMTLTMNDTYDDSDK